MVSVNALDLEELVNYKARIDLRGDVNLPSVGRVHAAGLTVEQLEAAITDQLKRLLQQPTVTVSIEDFRSQPVSVLGAVVTPGILQVQGRKTLFEILSQAGGLRPDAGNVIVITRQKEWGPIPLPGAKEDGNGRFYVAEVGVRSIMMARNPEGNILIEPNDVISVPKAEMVYVVGAVKQPGGYVLNERVALSILQALSLAGGLDRAAASNRAKIMRSVEGSTDRTEVPIDVKKILAGKSGDLPLLANDILFIPTSAGKNAAFRTVEAAITVSTAMVYRIP
jgi:polysaccharide export outer membrane protein